MFWRRYKELVRENAYLSQLVKDNRNADERERNNCKRIKESQVIFENVAGIRNLYVDDKLDFGSEIVIYDSEIAIENSVTHLFSKTEERKGLTVVGFLELEWCDDSYIKIHKLYVAECYRRCGLARKMLDRLVEFATIRNMKKIELFASAEGEISQEDLEKFYESVGFVKRGDGRTMTYEVT